MGVLIDSDVLINLERKGAGIASQIIGNEEEGLYLSVISASELLHGVYRASNPKIRANRLAFVEGVLASFTLLDIDLAVSRSHAQLWSQLEQRSEMVGVHDSWLAATCIAHGLTLITKNVHEFKRVPGLKVKEWM